MRLNLKLAAALLGVGLMAAPVMTPVALAAAPDAPKKEAPKDGAAPANPGRGGQRGGARGGNPVQMIERYHTAVLAVGLTDEQKGKIEPAFADAKTKAEAAAKEAGDDAAKAREKAQPIMEELRGKVNAVLTEEQKAKMQQGRQRGNGGNGGNRPAGGNRARGNAPAEQPKQ